MKINNEIKQRLYYQMLRIRRVQERIASRYLEDRMRTPVHLCIGQEAVAAGGCAPLERTDYISSNHRGHGHYLAKGGDLNALIAELHCRETGCAKGRGGSMHLIDTRVGHYGSSSIVGGGIPIGTGLGMASQMKGGHRVSVVFFGDGAADEGVLYESLNFAMLKKLPVIYILENNGYSVCSPVSARQSGPNVFHGVSPNRLFTALIDGNDVLAVYDAVTTAVRRARKGAGPSFIECRTYRILGHAGCAQQDAKGYRTEAEVAQWRERDPIVIHEKRCLREQVFSPDSIAVMAAQIQKEIDTAFEYAEKSPYPAASTLNRHLYRE